MTTPNDLKQRLHLLTFCGSEGAWLSGWSLIHAALAEITGTGRCTFNAASLLCVRSFRIPWYFLPLTLFFSLSLSLLPSFLPAPLFLLSTAMVSYSPGFIHVSWDSNNRTFSGKSCFLSGSWLSRQQGRSWQSSFIHVTLEWHHFAICCLSKQLQAIPDSRGG